MIEEKFKELCEKESDIQLHLPVIRKYVSEGDTVVEMGVRNIVSSWALVANKPKGLFSIDVVEPPVEKYEEFKKATEEAGITYAFLQDSSLAVALLKPVDVLFIDTIHTYSQLVKELWRHSGQVRKYIILHDTEIPEMKACVTDFLYNKQWEVVEELKTHMGLMVLKRV